MQLVCDAVAYYGVSCVGTAGKACNNRGITCKVIYNLSLALIAPLGTDHYNIHFFSFSISALYLAASLDAFWAARPR